MPRWIDIILSFLGLLFLSPILLLGWFLAAIGTKSTGVFMQSRVGYQGRIFKIYKLKTMNDGRVTPIGLFLRKSKLDELPQLFNVIKGDMAIVGPRPDIPGYYDQLTGDDRKVLSLKPGLTSDAAIKYRNEEMILSGQVDPKAYNDEVLFPDKVRMNLEYLENRTFFNDIKIIIRTLTSLIR